MADTLTVRIVGADRVVARLRTDRPAALREGMKRTVALLAYSLERRVKLDKLMGQVLNRRTGQLARSVNTLLSEPAPDVFVGSVGTRAKHGRIWELTGHRAFDLFPRRKKALFWVGALHPVAKVHIPAEGPRPFLRPALRDMRDEIRLRLRTAAGLTPTGGELPGFGRTRT